MDFMTLASEKRYSCRSFQERPIDQADMDRILEAGRIAPTAANRQPQRIFVVTGKEGLQKLTECTKYIYDAPAALVVCYDSDDVWVRKCDGRDSGDVDCSIVTTQMMLQAAELGVGTCWVGHFDPQRLRELFDLPENIVPVVILDMGYPDENGTPAPRHTERYPLEKTVICDS